MGNHATKDHVDFVKNHLKIVVEENHEETIIRILSFSYKITKKNN
jgi:hypothetical protein